MTYSVLNEPLGHGRMYFARRGWYVCPAGYSYTVGEHWFSDKFVPQDARPYLQSMCYTKTHEDLHFTVKWGDDAYWLRKFPAKDFAKFNRVYMGKHGWYLCPVFCDPYMRFWYTRDSISRGEHKALVYHLKGLAGTAGELFSVPILIGPKFSDIQNTPSALPVRNILVYKTYYLPPWIKSYE